MSSLPSVLEDKASQKLSPSMRKALIDLQKDCLSCSICQKVFDVPVTTIACAHTFCASCIDLFTENNWHCPVSSCNMPLAMKKGNGRFRNINSSMQSVVNSWTKICETLERAPDRWWEDGAKDDDDDDDSFVTAGD